MGKPVIIYRLGSLGDAIVALPCFHKIEQVFGDRPRIALTNKPVATNAAPLAVILGSSGLINGCINYPLGMRSPGDIVGVVREIRRTGADTLVYLAAFRGPRRIARDLMFFRLCGFRTIIGAPTIPGSGQPLSDPETNDSEPEAERLARTLEPSLGPIDLNARANWDLRLTKEEIEAGDLALAPLGGRPFVAFNLGGKQAINDWGDANWARLINQLSASLPDHALVAVGAKDDAARSEAALALWPGPLANLCGQLPPRHSAVVLSKAKLFVGHDSGPMHLAAAVGTPVVGLFGDNHRPRTWHPYGPGHQAIHDMRGVDKVEVEQVRHAVLVAAGAAS